MAGNSIRVNTDQVAQIASNIEGLNKRLTEELTNSKATIDQLISIRKLRISAWPTPLNKKNTWHPSGTVDVLGGSR